MKTNSLIYKILDSLDLTYRSEEYLTTVQFVKNNFGELEDFDKFETRLEIYQDQVNTWDGDYSDRLAALNDIERALKAQK